MNQETEAYLVVCSHHVLSTTLSPLICPYFYNLCEMCRNWCPHFLEEVCVSDRCIWQESSSWSPSPALWLALPHLLPISGPEALPEGPTADSFRSFPSHVSHTCATLKPIPKAQGREIREQVPSVETSPGVVSVGYSFSFFPNLPICTFQLFNTGHFLNLHLEIFSPFCLPCLALPAQGAAGAPHTPTTGPGFSKARSLILLQVKEGLILIPITEGHVCQVCSLLECKYWLENVRFRCVDPKCKDLIPLLKYRERRPPWHRAPFHRNEFITQILNLRIKFSFKYVRFPTSGKVCLGKMSLGFHQTLGK